MPRPNDHDIVDDALVEIRTVSEHRPACKHFRRDYGDGCICEYVVEAEESGRYSGWYMRERLHWRWPDDGTIVPGL